MNINLKKYFNFYNIALSLVLLIFSSFVSSVTEFSLEGLVGAFLFFSLGPLGWPFEFYKGGSIFPFLGGSPESYFSLIKLLSDLAIFYAIIIISCFIVGKIKKESKIIIFVISIVMVAVLAIALRYADSYNKKSHNLQECDLNNDSVCDNLDLEEFKILYKKSRNSSFSDTNYNQRINFAGDSRIDKLDWFMFNFLIGNLNQWPPAKEVFKTQEECELITDIECGKDIQEGWTPRNPVLNMQPPVGEKENNSSVVKKEISTPVVPPYTLSSRFGKIPIRISTSENIYPESSTTLLNSGQAYYPVQSATPELSRGKTVSVEGVYYVYDNSPRVDWAWNGNKSVSSRICLNKKQNIPDGTVIQVKIFISPKPEEYCEVGEVREYKILHTAPSLTELSKKFSPFCDDLTSFLAEKHRENPLKLYTCFGDVAPEEKFGEKFTHSDFEWLPFEDRMVIDMWAVSEKTTKENKDNICLLERRGAIVLNLLSEKIEEIYITQAEDVCEIIN